MKHLKIRIFILILLVLDLATKYFFYTLQAGPHVFFLQSTFNTGIARSVQVPLLVVIVITVLVMTGIYLLYFQKKMGWIFLGLFLAGALGNLIDRVRLGGVRDFINIGILNFPIFNIADIFLNIGIIGLLIQTFILEKRK